MRVRLAGRHVSVDRHRHTGKSSAARRLRFSKKDPSLATGPSPGKRRLASVGRFAAALCVTIHTPAENQLYPYSEHSCAHRHSHDFGKAVWRLRASNHRKPGVVMSIIPLDVQRRCERRWAARFSRPTESVAARNQLPERQSQQIAGPDKSKRKARRAEPGSRLLSAV
jgi:hypothetical protein